MKRLLLISLILLSLLVIPLSGCGEEKVVETGDNVKVHYTGTLNDGTVFDSSQGRDPLEFQVGGGQLIQGFDQAVNGMEEGDKVKVTLPPEQAYGTVRDELVLQVPKERFPGDADPEVGQRFRLGTGGDAGTPATVTAVTEEAVTLDANHPLAGKELTFEIELLAVVG